MNYKLEMIFSISKNISKLWFRRRIGFSFRKTLYFSNFKNKIKSSVFYNRTDNKNITETFSILKKI